MIVKYNNNDSYSSPVPPTTVPLKKNGCCLLPDSYRSKAVVQRDSSFVTPVPSAKIDRSTTLVIKNGTRCDSSGCPTGCNGKPVAKPLQLSKFSPKLSKLMNPLHFQQRPLGQQRSATAEKTGQQRVPHQHGTGFQRVPVENPFRYRSVAVGGFLEDGTSLMSASSNALEALIVVFTIEKEGDVTLLPSPLVNNRRLGNGYLFAMGNVLPFAPHLA